MIGLRLSMSAILALLLSLFKKWLINATHGSALPDRKIQVESKFISLVICNLAAEIPR
jgi:hypothetical protein